MKKLSLTKITIISDILKSANQFEFGKVLTIITANDNSVGKSTLAKMILWNFGCTPSFASDWKKYDCTSILDFNIDDTPFTIVRYKNSIRLFKNNQLINHYEKITGQFSSDFASLVGFDVLLPKKNTFTLEIPPPAYYFLPFYIDQKRSWATPWNSFENLQQYSNWKKPVLAFHCGLLNKEHFNFDKKIYSLKQDTVTIREKITNISNAQNIFFEEIINNTTTSSNNDESDERYLFINQEIDSFENKKSSLLAQKKSLLIDIAETNSQIKLSQSVINELEEDYSFAVEHFDDGLIECPTCGTLHENSITSRSEFLVDKTIAENQYTKLSLQLDKLIIDQHEIDKDIKNTTYHLNNLYDQLSQLSSVQADNFTINTITTKVNSFTNEKEIEIKNKEDLEKTQKIKKNGLLSNKQKKEIKENFVTTFTNYVTSLRVNINTETITSPFDYKKIYEIGGAAEDTRAILAYYLAFYEHVKGNSTEVIPPFIIDTPNQHEQSKTNYQRILNAIQKISLDDSQYILCAMENPALIDLKKEGKHHFIEGQLLFKDLYEQLKSECKYFI